MYETQQLHLHIVSFNGSRFVLPRWDIYVYSNQGEALLFSHLIWAPWVWPPYSFSASSVASGVALWLLVSASHRPHPKPFPKRLTCFCQTNCCCTRKLEPGLIYYGGQEKQHWLFYLHIPLFVQETDHHSQNYKCHYIYFELY